MCADLTEFCPPLNSPSNGNISNNNRAYNSVVTFSCKVGFTLQGSNSTRCLSNRTWGAHSSTCSRKLILKKLEYEKTDSLGNVGILHVKTQPFPYQIVHGVYTRSLVSVSWYHEAKLFLGLWKYMFFWSKQCRARSWWLSSYTFSLHVHLMAYKNRRMAQREAWKTHVTEKSWPATIPVLVC